MHIFNRMYVKPAPQRPYIDIKFLIRIHAVRPYAKDIKFVWTLILKVLR